MVFSWSFWIFCSQGMKKALPPTIRVGGSCRNPDTIRASLGPAVTTLMLNKPIFTTLNFSVRTKLNLFSDKFAQRIQQSEKNFTTNLIKFTFHSLFEAFTLCWNQLLLWRLQNLILPFEARPLTVTYKQNVSVGQYARFIRQFFTSIVLHYFLIKQCKFIDEQTIKGS